MSTKCVFTPKEGRNSALLFASIAHSHNHRFRECSRVLHPLCDCKNQLLLWLLCVVWAQCHGWAERWNGPPAEPAESRLPLWRFQTAKEKRGDETPWSVKVKAPLKPFSSLQNYGMWALWSANGWAAVLQRAIALHYTHHASRSPLRLTCPLSWSPDKSKSAQRMPKNCTFP